MAHMDWNNDGKIDMQDDIIEKQIYSQESKDTPNNNRGNYSYKSVVAVFAVVIVLFAIIQSSIERCKWDGCNEKRGEDSNYCSHHAGLSFSFGSYKDFGSDSKTYGGSGSSSNYNSNSSSGSSISSSSTTQSQTTKNETSTRKYYSSSNSDEKETYKDDPYDVYDYGDEEDFYYDNYDDFESYEDAEDYYNDAWDEY